jgi:alpha-L-fucosidase 2
MKKRNQILLLLVILAGSSISGQAKKEQKNPNLKLWYDTPADATAKDIPWDAANPTKSTYAIDEEWMKALPLGNGSFGVMVFGDVNRERIQLNEESMWSGGLNNSDNPGAKQYLPNIRRMLFEGNYRDATKLTDRSQISINNNYNHADGATDPFGCFQTMGDLWIDNHKTTDYQKYRRELDLTDAVVRVTYTQEGINYKREIFTSNPGQVMVARFTADQPGKISFTCSMTRPERFNAYTENDQLILAGALYDGKGGENLEYMARLKVVNKGGVVTYGKSEVIIQNADEVTIFISGSTGYLNRYPDFNGRDYKKITKKNIELAVKKDFNDLLAAHKAEYQNYFNRVSLDLTPENVEDIPTDERVEKFKETQSDPHLVELVFQYGRYLLISSSRPNTLPANLQGIWANKIQTPWNGDYHPDINIQMNYWPAEVTNLPEMHLPYFDYLASLVEPGKKTASIQYGMDGWVIHTVGNIWGHTSPGEKAGWGLHIGASGWMCQHIMEHYRFTGDKEFLLKLYPILKEASRFYAEWLVKDPKTGRLVSGPSISPENSFIAPDGTTSAYSMGCAHDQQVIWQLFTDFLEASDLLDITDSLTDLIREKKSGLASGWEIGSDGCILEWAEELKEKNPQSGHISHMYAFYPTAQITYEKTPELARAAYKSILLRYNEKPKHGWSGAWLISQFARHRDQERAAANLNSILQKGIHPNLFTSTPFQMDANFGTTAGIAELLIQSHTGSIDLLPCLPKEFKTGKVTGLRARGGFEIDIDWSGGNLVSAVVKSLNGQKCTIRATVPFSVKGIGSTSGKDDYGYVLSFDSEKGRSYSISAL